MIDNNYSARDLAHFLSRFLGPIEQNLKVIRERFKKRYADDQDASLDLMPAVRNLEERFHYLKVTVHDIKKLDQQATRDHVEWFLYRLDAFKKWANQEVQHLVTNAGTGSEENNYDGWGDIGRVQVVIKNEMVKRLKTILDYIENSKIEEYMRNVWSAVK